MSLTRQALSELPPAYIAMVMRGPAALPPPGVSAQDTADMSILPQNTFVMVFCMTISTLALAARSYTKLSLMKKWNLEDTLLVLSWILLVIYTVQAELGVQYGLTKHMWNIVASEFFQALYHINFCAIIYCVVMVLLKVAILLQYIRIFVPNRDSNRLLYYTCYTTMAFVIIFNSIIAIMAICMCYPREAYWNPYVQGSCFDWALLSQINCILTIVSDLALFIIPIIPVAKLQVPRTKKVMIGIIFALGFIDCIAAIIRTYYTWQLTESVDISWNIAIMGTWTWVEMSFGVLVASLPVSPRFYKHSKQQTSLLINGVRRKTSASSSIHSAESKKMKLISLPVIKTVEIRVEGETYSLPEPPERVVFLQRFGRL